MSLVSVIVPIHNRFRLVDESITSIHNQTHRPIQLILVDDCSDKPYTPKMISQPGFEVILIRHATNLGPGASRETGRQAAEGNFIAYLDSDDLWHPQKLAKQVAMLRANPDAGMCYCTSVEFQILPLTGKEKIRKKSNQCFDQILPTIFSGRPWDTSACLWTRSAVEKIGPWISAWVWEDYDYDCRAGCEEIKLTYVPEILCYYRSGGNTNQLSKRDFHASLVDSVRVLYSIIENLRLYQKLQDTEINNAVRKKLFYFVSELFMLNDYEHGIEALAVLVKLSDNWQKGLFSFIKILSRFVCLNQLGKLQMKTARYIFPN